MNFVLCCLGGMLLVKLDADDLQFDKMNPFDGTMAYAQNKRQQVVMTEQWAKKYKSTGIHFSAMHPGEWDLPDYYNALVSHLL